MKTAFTLAVLAALAATPVVAHAAQQSSDQMQHQQGMTHQRQALNTETIRNIQENLQKQGYQVGQVDGVLGKQTRQALAQFQKDQGISGNGQPNQQTLAALGVGPGATQQAQTPEERNPQAPQSPNPQSPNFMQSQPSVPPGAETQPQGGGMMNR
jgi:peptidoglycan hydrolase-like protein with peptidoglycan-binding domain